MATDDPSSSPPSDEDLTRSRPAVLGTRALLDALAAGDGDDSLTLASILAGLSRQVFGMLLFVATLPAFIPIPGVGGAIGGPLTVLVGVHLLVGMRKLWLPGFVARRGPRRASLQAFDRLISPWLARLEKLVKPRMTALIERRAASMFTGLLLVLLGILLALPIPFTNYLFGVLLLAFALALLERDGLLMLLCWIAGVIAIAVFGVASGTLAAAATQWLGKLLA
ncbi:MAG: exopolysaccharide biosynthesis protein [Proteobacteria bacterium]|nr:exopolysaccharide biosynthesis protein [Pseudomonadota bacterium]